MHNNSIKLSILKENETVEKFLKNTFSLSRNQIKKSKLGKSFLSKQLRYKDEIQLPIDLVNYLIINPRYSGSEVRVVSESEHTLVLSKPSRCHIHPLSYDETDNILSFIRSKSKWNSFLCINKKSYDRSLLYRLDYETSGLVILTNGEINRSDIKAKIYLAVVEGHITDKLNLEHCITTTGKKIKESHSGEPSKCIIKPIAYDKNKNLSFVLVKLKEGRRHQIRIQLSLAGYPILGDLLYGAKKPSQYFGLHCLSYSFSHHSFFDENIPFSELLKSFLDIDSNLKMLCDEFRVSESR